MNLTTRTVMPAARALFAACLLAALTACNSKTEGPSPFTIAPAQLPGLDKMLAEMTMGDAAAPIVMVEYSSLSCTYCADFHVNTLPLIKSQYIDTGKVRFVYRDFPLDYSAALTASLVARCAPDSYFTVIDLIYRSRDSWADSSNVKGALKTLVAPVGLTSQAVDACVASADLRTGILVMRAKAQSDYGIYAVPSFLINGNLVQGALPYGSFATIFDTLLQ